MIVGIGVAAVNERMVARAPRQFRVNLIVEIVCGKMAN